MLKMDSPSEGENVQDNEFVALEDVVTLTIILAKIKRRLYIWIIHRQLFTPSVCV